MKDEGGRGYRGGKEKRGGRWKKKIKGMRKRVYGMGVLLAVMFAGCKVSEKYFVKDVVFPEGASPEQKIEMAARVVPTEGQYNWQQLELTAFIHFGINTFTGREWGDGKEDPALFNPTGLDCEQWVKALKAGGFKMVIITAKHHDGFCLWPTKTTKHSVASSPWKDGKGDVVGDLRKACDKYGLKFGVYLSPWDRNAACYGDSPVYNRMFVAQLRELLSNYGKVDEVWFDGANGEGPNGKKQVYDWELFNAVIDSLQPHAVKAITGNDIRWVGNERGLGRETEWSVTPYWSSSYSEAEEENKRLGLKGTAKDLGSREKVTAAKRLFWYPSEVDVSIRPGWFYHPEQDAKVRSLANLVDIYFRSVGYNSVLLLNIPPDRRGLINEVDVARLKEFGEYISGVFADNKLPEGEKSRTLKAGESVEYQVRPGEKVNVFLVGEDILKGQRVEEFTVEGLINGEWRELAKGSTVGYKRLFRFPECRPGKIRFTLDRSRADMNIRMAGAYYAPELSEKQPAPRHQAVRKKDWKVSAADSETEGHKAQAAIDGDPATYWKTLATGDMHRLELDFGKTLRLAGFTYVPASADEYAGTVFLYKVYVSSDGQNWTLCETDGEFSNIKHNPIPQTVKFKTIYPARYFRFETVREIDGRPFVTVGEIDVLTP